MKNRLPYTVFTCSLFLLLSCGKDITGNPITIEAYSNIQINDFDLYASCSPGPGGLPLGYPDSLNGDGSGNYTYQIESGYDNDCFTITGDIPSNNDTIGKTTIDIAIFYTDEGNVVGFKDIKLKRPHGQYAIRYEFRPDTYVE